MSQREKQKKKNTATGDRKETISCLVDGGEKITGKGTLYGAWIVFYRNHSGS